MQILATRAEPQTGVDPYRLVPLSAEGPCESEDTEEGPPFALTREVMDSLAVDGLAQVRAEELDRPLWRVEYRR
jgi:hypothetical protein